MKKLFTALAFLLICGTALADTHTVASPYAASDVTDAITAASTGDTVYIPACNVTWTSAVSIPSSKKLIIQGAGKTSTVITTDTVSAILMNESGSRLTALGFVMTGAGTGQINVQGVGWRIDHCKFTNSYGSSRVTIYVNGENVSSAPTGLIDNNEFIEARIIIRGASNLAEANVLWADEYPFGDADTTGNGTVYVEDNTFYKTVSGGGNVVDAEAYRTGYFTARYNTVTGNTSFMAHPGVTSNDRGTRGWEVYGNSFVADSSATYTPMFLRSGTGYIFGNYYSNYSVNGPVFDIWRLYQAVSGTTTTGYCDGSLSASGGNYDGDSASGYPCRDQIGWGTDKWNWNTTPYPPQTQQPVYLWANRTSASANGTVSIANGADSYIVANRDFYNSAASFNGTTGTGCGTLAARPATCTTGVGYWATNQSCTDLTGMIGVAPATPISGTLYVCTSTNTWTDTYSPYTYPHPLQESVPITLTCYLDADADGYSDGTSESAETCSANYYKSGDLTATSGDCDDSDAEINPGATDAGCDGIDQDCSGSDNCPPSPIGGTTMSGPGSLRITGTGTLKFQ